MRRFFVELCLLVLAISFAISFESLYARAETPANGVPNNGTPSNGTPLNGTQSNGIPSNGTPSNGAPSNGVPSNGLNLQVIENSALFGNRSVFTDLTQHPLTAVHLTDPANPIFQFWSDSNSVLLMSYIWENAHRAGDDLVFCPAENGTTPVGSPCGNPANQTFHFYGGLGVCDYSAANERALPAPPAGQQGWAVDEPLSNPASPPADIQCQHWVSAALLSQNNEFHVHNLFSAMGPSSDQGPSFIGNQLTSAAGAVFGSPYSFGTETPVQSVIDPCTPGTTGPVNCGWTSAFIAVCSPFDTVKVQTQGNTSQVNLMVMVNQGIHANNYPFSSGGNGASDGNFLGASVADSSPSPSFAFQCPPSGTFNVQWAPYDRNNISTLPPNITFTTIQISAASPSSVPPAYPADELDIFKRSNREGYFAGNLFADINPSLYMCEVRINQPVTGSNVVTPGAQLCDPNVSASCTPCARGVINFAVMPDGSQVPASDVSTANIQLGSLLGGTQDYWSSRGVTFSNTGLLTEAAVIPGGDGASTHPDGWCPAGGFNCSGNNIVVLNSPMGNDPANGTPTLDTLQIHFAQAQQSATVDIDNGYLGLSPQTTVELKLSGVLLDTLTLVESCPAGGCPSNTIPEIAACPQSQNSSQLCGRFQLSDSAGTAFDEIDVLPTTISGATAACTITTSGHAGSIGPGGEGTNYDANCGGSLIDNLAFGGFAPGSNTVVFPDAHSWFEPTFGTSAYAAQRACSPDLSSCIDNYEGPMSTGPAACTNLSFDLDSADSISRTYSGSARPLFDVGGCSFANFASSSPRPAVFSDDGLTSYPAYGVTSFFANYGTGIDGFGVKCTGNQAPTATATACDGGSCGTSITASEGDSITLDATGSSDPDGDPLAYAWSEAANLVAPSVSSNPKYAFAVPVGTAGGTLIFGLTASDACYLVDRLVDHNPPQSINVHVKANSTTKLTSSVNPSAVGQPVTFTAKVSCSGSCSGVPTPTGTVAFSQISGPPVTFSPASGTLDSSGQVKVTASGTTATFSLEATYSGDGNFNGSTGTFTQNVTLDPTTTKVSFSANPVILGQPVKITATVTTPGLGTPNDGTITFFDGSTQLGPPVTVSSGIATLTTSTLAIGAHPIKASYSGDTTTFAPSVGTATLNVTYKVVAEYSQTTGNNSGTSIPIKVQLQNFAGKNLSSSGITLTLTPNPVLPSPALGAQPGGTFAFMSKSDVGPEYQYNLKTTSFPAKTYTLSFTATGDPVTHNVGFVVF